MLAIGAAEDRAAFRARWPGLPVPLAEAELKPLRMGMDWAGARVLAFAGIGHPEKFFASLRAEGAEVVRGEALDDHQPLSEALLRRLELEAEARGAQLVTTEKDAVRLPAAFRPKVLTLVVRLEVVDWGPLDGLLDRVGA